ncbi:MAG TPA: lysyl oxidase family protein [Pilimelia sp.]|nr:lysyl oxidase family protein [Pilimelia sp.]
MKPIIRGLAYAGSAVLAATAALNSAHAATADDPGLRLATYDTVAEASLDPATGLAWTDLEMYLTNGDKPLEIEVRRTAYDKPVDARVRRDQADPGADVPVPSELLTDLTGLQDFFTITVTNPRDEVVASVRRPLCPNGADTRMAPDAPAGNPYPEKCNANPFSHSTLWGMPKRWGLMPFYGEGRQIGLPLKTGSYRAEVTIAPRYRALLGIADAHATRTIRLRVAPGTGQKVDETLDPRLFTQPGTLTRPTGAARVPRQGPLPDMRALPAWDITVEHGASVDGLPDRDLVKFGSTVWVDGDAPLFVQGFRESKEPLMVAYQYFFDADGKETGYAKVGGMEWDPRPGHLHWHFQDFAGYRLLREDGSAALTGTKEAFCIANTDQVDLLNPRAVHRPANVGLRVDECGGEAEMEVQQRLDVGWGDTYGPERPDQELDVTDVPNGTYQIEVNANPKGNLHEKTTANNRSVRTIVLGGTPGKRTVSVPPVGLIQA